MTEPRTAPPSRRALLFALLFSALGSLALLMPMPPLPRGQWLFNLAHVPLLALLAWLWLRALGELGLRPAPALAVVLIGGAAASGLLEFLQFYIPGRWPDWQDFGLNLLGLVLGAWLAWRAGER